MNLLFVADPLEGFKIHKDTTFAMMREAQRRGHRIAFCQDRDLSWQKGGMVHAWVRFLELTGETDPWFRQTNHAAHALKDFDAILMRKDPPFDAEYIHATHLLQQAEREGARVFNSPQALRDHPEKLAIMEWPQFVGPTLVTRSPDAIRQFHRVHQDIIVKPLDGMGGEGVFRIKADGLNLTSIIESLGGGAQTLMVQQFLPEISAGDKRVLIIDGQPVPYCLARMAKAGEVRANLAAGGVGVAQPLTDSDRNVAEQIGAALAPRGLLLIGLDIIGTHVTEINVTSPTCFQEIQDQTDCNVSALFVDALEKKLAETGR